MLGKVRIPVCFTIYGPVEDETYWADCQELTAKLPACVDVVHQGLIEPAKVIPTLAQHDLFLFPTRGENYGHVIHEALRAGLPVLISDQTPWRGLAGLGVGWDLSLGDDVEFVKRIEEVAAWTDKERQRCSARARAYAATAAEDPANLEANRRLFLDVIHDSAAGIQAVSHSKARNVQE
jgi:glycosyltransferase involved in cell wall biosynthesis